VGDEIIDTGIIGSPRVGAPSLMAVPGSRAPWTAPRAAGHGAFARKLIEPSNPALPAEIQRDPNRNHHKSMTYIAAAGGASGSHPDTDPV
jgi:hypothetical protein